MSSCTNRYEDFDVLSDDEFTELVNHSFSCEMHSKLLTAYEQSIIPALKMALPELVIATAPYSPNWFAKLWMPIAAWIRIAWVNRSRPIGPRLNPSLSGIAGALLLLSIGAIAGYFIREKGEKPTLPGMQQVEETLAPYPVPPSKPAGLSAVGIATSAEMPPQRPPGRPNFAPNTDPYLIAPGNPPAQDADADKSSEESKAVLMPPTNAHDKLPGRERIVPTTKYAIANVSISNFKDAKAPIECYVASKREPTQFIKFAPNEKGQCNGIQMRPGETFSLRISVGSLIVHSQDLFATSEVAEFNIIVVLPPPTSKPESTDIEPANCEPEIGAPCELDQPCSGQAETGTQ